MTGSPGKLPFAQLHPLCDAFLLEKLSALDNSVEHEAPTEAFPTAKTIKKHSLSPAFGNLIKTGTFCPASGIAATDAFAPTPNKSLFAGEQSPPLLVT